MSCFNGNKTDIWLIRFDLTGVRWRRIKPNLLRFERRFQHVLLQSYYGSNSRTRSRRSDYNEMGPWLNTWWIQVKIDPSDVFWVWFEHLYVLYVLYVVLYSLDFVPFSLFLRAFSKPKPWLKSHPPRQVSLSGLWTRSAVGFVPFASFPARFRFIPFIFHLIQKFLCSDSKKFLSQIFSSFLFFFCLLKKKLFILARAVYRCVNWSETM